jgi:hypothetical protein
LAVFNLGLILYIVEFAMRRFEYAPVVRVRRTVDRTRFIRAAGMLTLTLYVLEFPVRAAFSYAAHGLFGGSTNFPATYAAFQFDQFMINPAAILLYLAAIMTFWLLLVRVLIGLRFVGSFEWMFAKLANVFRRHDKSGKADMERILSP